MHAFTLYHLSPTLANHKHTHNHVISLVIYAPTHNHVISLVIYAPTLPHTTPLASVCYSYNLSHTVVSLVLYAVDKGFRGRNVLQSLLLILLRICSRSVRPMSIYVHSFGIVVGFQLPNLFTSMYGPEYCLMTRIYIANLSQYSYCVYSCRLQYDTRCLLLPGGKQYRNHLQCHYLSAPLHG